MGYDIVTVEGNEEEAKKFAAKYQYTYLFDKETGQFVGGGQVYFRANIWAMAPLRRVMDSLLYVLNIDEKDTQEFIESISWNDGRLVTSEFLTRVLNKLDKVSNGAVEEYIKPIVTTVTLEMWNPEEDSKVSMFVEGQIVQREYSPEEKAKDTTAIAMEFLDYMRVAKGLGGFEVW